MTLEHELKDDFFFYRFTDPARRTSRIDGGEVRLHVNEDLSAIAEILKQVIDVRDRTYRLTKYKNVFVASEAVSVMMEQNLAKSREEAVELGRRLQSEGAVWHHECHDHQFKDEFLFFRFTNPESISSINEIFGDVSSAVSAQSISVSVVDMSRGQLHSIAEQLRRGLRVKDRMYRFKMYRICFVASEAVDFMVKENLARSREEAVDLGRRLEEEFAIWHHVTNDHRFQDKYLFFRFSRALDQQLTQEDEDLGNSIANSESFAEHTFSLNEISAKLRRGIQVKDRTYHFKTYKKCFVGCDAVDFMVQARLAQSRHDAVKLGQQLTKELRFFHHVTNDHPFEDGYLFYQFSEMSTDDTTVSSAEDFSEGHSASEDPSVQSLSTEDLVAVGEKLRRGVRIKHRQYRLKTYRNCFIGLEAVDYMVHSGLAQSRAHAVELGRRLSAELDYLHHVTHDHVFEDAYLFFRFNTADRTKSSVTDWSGSHSSLVNSFSAMDINFPLKSERLQFERNLSLRKEKLLRLKAIRRKMSECQQVVLVGGPSGCGKSCLVYNALADDHTVLFATAKFDQRSQLTPFQTLRLLFTDLSKRIRVSSDVARIQHQLEEEFTEAGAQKSALASWIPEMTGLFMSIPDQKSVQRRSDNMSLIQLSLHSFLRAVSAVTPIVMCLDDIMWSDSRTFEILHFILTRDMGNIMFCATFRDNKFEDGHPFIEWQSQLEDHLISVETMFLKNLDLHEIQGFIATCLKLEEDEDDVGDLAELLLDRTHGNLFFLVHTMESLQDLSLIFYDFGSMRWTFSVDLIRTKTRVADNVGELLSSRIEQLPRDVQQVLKLCACFGSGFDPEILERTKSVLFIFDDIDNCLHAACEEELLIRVSDRQYLFAHDHVQSAAYQLLPDGQEKKRIHWEIGLKLSMKRIQIDEGDCEWYFTVADQMKLSGEVLRAEIRDEDRPRIAGIFLNAGQQAAKISAFVPAAQYFREGIDALGGDTKKIFATNYRLSAKLFLAYAQALISAGDVQQSRKFSETLILASSNDEDKRSANMAIFRCLSAENNLEEQIDFGLQLLDALGTKVPKHPNRVQLTMEYERAMSDLKKHNESELLGLPPMSDKNIEFCIDILCTLLQSGKSLGRIFFVCYTLAKLVQLTLRHGICKFTPLILVFVGQDLIASGNDLKGGHRFLQMGLTFQNRIESADTERGSLLTQSCMAIGCVEPLSKSMYLGLDAYKVSVADGDMGNAFHGASVYLWSFFYSGLPFKPLLEDVEKFAMQMLEYKQTRYFFYTTPIFQLLLCLSGQEENNHDISKGKAIEMNDLVESKSQYAAAAETLMAYGMQLAVYMGDDEKALEYYERLKDINMGIGKATAAYHVRLFFFGIICVQNFRQSRKNRFKSEAKKYTDTLRELVDGGAINLPHKLVLLEAELASLTSKDFKEIIRKYEKSIFAASRAGFLQDAGLANYLCAQFCLREGNEHSAETYLIQAASLYSSWGAVAVVNTIKERYSSIFPEVDTQPRHNGSGFRSRTNFRASFALMHKSLSKARGLAIVAADTSSTCRPQRKVLPDAAFRSSAP